MSDNRFPLYIKVYDELLERIQNNHYKENEKLPSENDLTEQFGVSKITIKKALEMLTKEGYVIRIPGKGSFINSGYARSNTYDNNTTKSFANVETLNNQKFIGIIMDDYLSGFGADIVYGMEKEAEKHGYSVIAIRSHGSQVKESKAIDTLMSIGAEAIVIMPVHGEYYSEKILRLVLEGFPLIFMDRKLQGIPAPFIGSDNEAAAKKAVEYLFSIGHENILVISPPQNANSLTERINGIKLAFDSASSSQANKTELIIDSILPEMNEREYNEENIKNIENMLRNNNNITAILCLQYRLALMAKKAISNLNKSIPSDYSLLCFDENYDVLGCQFFTHIKQQEEKMGEMAVIQALKKLENPSSQLESKLFDTELIICESTKAIK